MANQENYLREDNDSQAENEIKETLFIPVISEELKIEKKLIETGKIRISKKITEETEFINVPLIREEIDIKRIQLNQYVDVIPEAVRYEGDTMIIPVLKEVPVIRTMLVEEIHITRKKIQTLDSRDIILRKENITIENIAPDPSTDHNI